MVEEEESRKQNEVKKEAETTDETAEEMVGVVVMEELYSRRRRYHHSLPLERTGSDQKHKLQRLGGHHGLGTKYPHEDLGSRTLATIHGPRIHWMVMKIPHPAFQEAQSPGYPTRTRDPPATHLCRPLHLLHEWAVAL